MKTLQEKLESAQGGLNHAISRSYKTGYAAQASMIDMYQREVEVIKRQIKESK